MCLCVSGYTSILINTHTVYVRSQHRLLWFCQEPWIHSWLKTVHEEARHKNMSNCLFRALHALVRSAGFSLNTQPRLLLLPISSHGLTTATVSSWCTPNSVIQPLQKIQNFVARLVLLAPRHQHSTPLLEKLHWLPISERIKYRVACMCFSAINGSGPAYLSELVHVYTPSRTLCSSSDTRMLKIQQYNMQDLRLSHLLLLWTPRLEFTRTRP